MRDLAQLAEERVEIDKMANMQLLERRQVARKRRAGAASKRRAGEWLR